MSGANIEKKKIGAQGSIKEESGYRPPISHPKNCSNECPYGYDRPFCFPCYKKLMEEMRSTRKG